MTSTLNPYIAFPGDARSALSFYQEVFGGELRLNTFGDFGSPAGMDPELIMHGMLTTDAGLTLMGSDNPGGATGTTGRISISLSGEDEPELRGYWDKLSASGTVNMPLEKQMWGDQFGMVTDQFGVDWMVNIVASTG